MSSYSAACANEVSPPPGHVLQPNVVNCTESTGKMKWCASTVAATRWCPKTADAAFAKSTRHASSEDLTTCCGNACIAHARLDRQYHHVKAARTTAAPSAVNSQQDFATYQITDGVQWDQVWTNISNFRLHKSTMKMTHLHTF